MVKLESLKKSDQFKRALKENKVHTKYFSIFAARTTWNPEETFLDRNLISPCLCSLGPILTLPPSDHLIVILHPPVVLGVRGWPLILQLFPLFIIDIVAPPEIFNGPKADSQGPSALASLFILFTVSSSIEPD